MRAKRKRKSTSMSAVAGGSRAFKLTPQVVPEKAVETMILSFLWSRKIFSWKVNSVGVFDQQKGIYRKPKSIYIIKGVSDILGIIPPLGRVLAIEVKSAKGRASPEQIAFLDRVNKDGGIGFIARSYQEVEARLKSEGVIS